MDRARLLDNREKPGMERGTFCSLAKPFSAKPRSKTIFEKLLLSCPYNCRFDVHHSVVHSEYWSKKCC